jgi:hypothetical protein
MDEGQIQVGTAPSTMRYDDAVGVDQPTLAIAASRRLDLR